MLPSNILQWGLFYNGHIKGYNKGYKDGKRDFESKKIDIKEVKIDSNNKRDNELYFKLNAAKDFFRTELEISEYDIEKKETDYEKGAFIFARTKNEMSNAVDKILGKYTFDEEVYKNKKPVVNKTSFESRFINILPGQYSTKIIYKEDENKNKIYREIKYHNRGEGNLQNYLLLYKKDIFHN